MKNQINRFLTIGSASSRRVQFWEKALKNHNINHEILSYDQIWNTPIDAFPKIIEPTYLRITSPGEDFELKKLLLKIGGFAKAENLFFEKGLILPQTNWYRGWCIVLQKIENYVSSNPLVKIINSPTSIQLAFHKLKCQRFLSDLGISTPKILLDKVSDYNSLIDFLEKEKIYQVFIKPYHGSSASGVMAFRQSKGKQVLYTTIELKDNRLFNHLKLQKYSSPSKIKTIIDLMTPSGLFVEEWIRKKTFQKKSVDFRVLVVDGKAAFVVPRMSKHLITNLHLGNEKGNIESVENAWGNELVNNGKELAEDAVKSIGGMFYAGVDVAISNQGKAYILEVNAFGDMLLNISYEGLDTYEFELKQLLSL